MLLKRHLRDKKIELIIELNETKTDVNVRLKVGEREEWANCFSI